MRLRALLKRDQEFLRTIHEKYYKDDFPFDYLSKLVCSFVITNESDKLITAGGIRSIAEVVLVTDKDAPILSRQEALLATLEVAGKTAKDAGYDKLHAFVQDEHWMRHLIRHGFQPTAGKSLIIGV